MWFLFLTVQYSTPQKIMAEKGTETCTCPDIPFKVRLYPNSQQQLPASTPVAVDHSPFYG